MIYSIRNSTQVQVACSSPNRLRSSLLAAEVTFQNRNTSQLRDSWEAITQLADVATCRSDGSLQALVPESGISFPLSHLKNVVSPVTLTPVPPTATRPMCLQALFLWNQGACHLTIGKGLLLQYYSCWSRNPWGLIYGVFFLSSLFEFAPLDKS